MKLPLSRHNQRVGSTGEQIAASHLQKLGYSVLFRNFKARYGEIDIICQKDNVLVFVEVKTRTGGRFGVPEEAVTPRKLREIKKTAEYFSLVHNTGHLAQRIDVIAILLSPESDTHAIRHLQNVTM